MFRRNKSHAEGDYRKGGLVRSGVRALSGGIGLVSESFKSSGQSKVQSSSEPDPALLDSKSAKPAAPSYSESSHEGNSLHLALNCRLKLTSFRSMDSRCA